MPRQAIAPNALALSLALDVATHERPVSHTVSCIARVRRCQPNTLVMRLLPAYEATLELARLSAGFLIA